jgi:competence protein CoiA
MVAKCGPRIVHHWAHRGRRNCDPWWENETAWHREWKEQFPADCREVCHLAPDGEIHRADIKTRTGIIIEVQHSAISDAERISREKFYGNLVWVIDGSTFEENIVICHLLPAPSSELAGDLIWFKATKNSCDGMFYRRSENKPGAGMVLVHSARDIRDDIRRNWHGHRQYNWVRPRSTWLDATCPVYIDLGDEFLVKLEDYGEQRLPCVRMISKRKFVHDAMVEEHANDIATRFYAVNKS